MKTAVVTGSTRGIGRAIAKALEDIGYAVIYSARSESMDGVKYYKKCDISQESDRIAITEYAFNSFGHVDILVNNAGVAPINRMDILETTKDSFRQLISINLEGTFFMCQAFANYMIKHNNNGGRIINIASMSSYASSIMRGEYCVSKAGISMVTQLFAHRLAEHDIGVFEVRPGIIETDMTSEVIEKYEKQIENGLTPIKRLGKPEDVANCVKAIAQGYLDFTTGQVLNADGGFHIRRF